MTIDEAIDLLDDCLSENQEVLYPDLYQAHRLGIEALERTLRARTGIELSPYVLFEGETKKVKDGMET